MIRVLSVDDHPLLRDGIAELVGNQSDMGGIDAISAIRREFPEARIIVLTTYTGDVQVMRALKAGARGYLLKGLLRKELIETVRAVHIGQRRMAAEIAAEVGLGLLLLRFGAAVPLIYFGVAGVAMLGPGAWSVDAHFFGRKRFEVNGRHRRKDPSK